MKKLLLMLFNFAIVTNPISNFNYTTNHFFNNMTSKNNINDNLGLNTLETQQNLKILTDWHDSLSIEQDEQAKQDYVNAMKITTNISPTGDFDTYNITFDNEKLQSMVNKHLINQDVYNIMISKNTSLAWTNEANSIANVPSDVGDVKIRSFKNDFYIENNQLFFVDKDHQNLDKKHNNLKTNKLPVDMLLGSVSDFWWKCGIIDIAQYDELITNINNSINLGQDQEQIDTWFQNYIMELIKQENKQQLILFLTWVKPATNNQSSYIFLNAIEKNIKDIYEISSQNNHSGTSDVFTFWDLNINYNSIQKIILSEGKYTNISDVDKAKWNFNQKITRIYSADPLINYYGYSSLWQYLNMEGETFNINEIFQSYVGLLNKYVSSNFDFNKMQSTSMLKKYWNNWSTLTSVSWTNKAGLTSIAEWDLQITDNPWTKAVEFNFKSILCNINKFDSIGNSMY